MMEKKQKLRNIFLDQRRALDPEKFSVMESAILKNIRASNIYHDARKIAIYYPIRREISLLPLLEDPDKRFCFPRITDYEKLEMQFFWNTGEFTSGRFGLSEPVGPLANKNEIDMIIVPGLAYSRGGYRIGYGKGFYDRYLMDYPKVKLGIAFSFQVVDELPHADYDVRLDRIITDKEEICIQH